MVNRHRTKHSVSARVLVGAFLCLVALTILWRRGAYPTMTLTQQQQQRQMDKGSAAADAADAPPSHTKDREAYDSEEFAMQPGISSSIRGLSALQGPLCWDPPDKRGAVEALAETLLPNGSSSPTHRSAPVTLLFHAYRPSSSPPWELSSSMKEVLVREYLRVASSREAFPMLMNFLGMYGKGMGGEIGE